MTFSFLWFALGLAVGVNATLAGLWWSLRREDRKTAKRFPAFTAITKEDLDPLGLDGIEWPDVHELRDSYGRPMPLASRRADQ